MEHSLSSVGLVLILHVCGVRACVRAGVCVPRVCLVCALCVPRAWLSVQIRVRDVEMSFRRLKAGEHRRMSPLTTMTDVFVASVSAQHRLHATSDVHADHEQPEPPSPTHTLISVIDDKLACLFQLQATLTGHCLARAHLSVHLFSPVGAFALTLRTVARF